MYVHSTHLRKFVEIEFQSRVVKHTFNEFNTTYYVQGNKMHVFALTARHILALSSSVRSEKKLPLEDIFCLFLKIVNKMMLRMLEIVPFIWFFHSTQKNNVKCSYMYIY